MTTLTRKQKRNYLTHTTIYRRVRSLGFNHPERIAFNDMMKNQKENAFAKNIESVREKLSESLATHEKQITEKLVKHNVSQENISAYLEKWVEVNFWPAPKNLHKIKRELNKLNKQYFI